MLRYLFMFLVILIPFLALAKNDSFIQSASIVADSIEIDAKGNLTAKGNVEIHHDDNILKAQEIFYQRSSDKLTAKGIKKGNLTPKSNLEFDRNSGAKNPTARFADGSGMLKYGVKKARIPKISI